MKKEFFLIALGAIMMLTACEKIVIPEDEEASPIPTGELDGSAQLMISTRTGGLETMLWRKVASIFSIRQGIVCRCSLLMRIIIAQWLILQQAAIRSML